MDHWELLNWVRKSLYCNKRADLNQELKKLITLASKSDDAEFIKCVLLLREDAASVSTKVKLLWLTSAVGRNFYPPLDVELASPLYWNGPFVLDTRLPELRSKYLNKTSLKLETERELRQCQDIDNCSFVASLIGLKVQNVSRPKTRQLSENIYAVNLHFNGANNRLVTVDASQIPTDEDSNQLSIHSRDLADKIVELAYLQITAGSYDTNGSNCAIDTFRLTGYLPEIVAASRIDIKRLIKYFQSGFCIIAIGTGTHASSLVAPLRRDHDYAVVAVNEDTDSLTIQDPLDPGIKIEIDKFGLETYCEQVYLNWCHSKLFYYSTSLHFFYEAKHCNQFNSVTDKPTFMVKNRSKSVQSVRLLLETTLREASPSDNRVAYLREVPRDALIGNFDEPTGACNIGLQLLKLDLNPGQGIRLFCHSSHSESFTATMVYNSDLVSFNREMKSNGYRCIVFDPPKDVSTNTHHYFENPAIMVQVNSPLSEEVSIHMQLLSDSPEDMINAQVYHINDHAMTRPVEGQAKFEQQKFDLRHVRLITNTPYKVVCSCYPKALSDEFKLIVQPASSGESIYLDCKLKQVYLEYNGLPHHLRKRFQWPPNGNRIKIRLTSKSNNLCFIRIVPMATSSSLPVRCNIFNKQTHGSMYTMEHYERPDLGGLVIDQLSINDCPSIVLLIEKDEALLFNNTLPPVAFELFIGSQTKMAFID